MATKVPTPVINPLSANTGMSLSSSPFSTAGMSPVDSLRQFMMFELVNVDQQSTEVPQSSPVFPYMVLHVNPESLEENYQKIITRQITRGGYLEQHWGEELDTIQCSGSTGLFISVKSGLSALNRKASIAYRKYLELVALYRNDGCVYDQRGNIVFVGGVNLHFDSNIFYGYFENLNIDETAENPYTFQVDFLFKVQKSYRTLGG